MSTIQIFGFIGVLLIVGFLADFLFRKTGFPDILILLAIGYLVGPGYHLANPSDFATYSQLVSSLALIVIVFSGGIQFEIARVLSSAARAFVLVVVGVTLSIAFVASPVYFILHWSLLQSILLGTIVGGTSSAIVIGLVNRARVSPEASSLLTLESILNSPVVIVIALIVLRAISSGEAGVEIVTIAQTIGIRIALGLGIGLAGGIAWLAILRLLQREEYNDVLNLAIAFLLYFVVEYLDGSGVVCVLVFGLLLGNGLPIGKFRLSQPAQASQFTRRFIAEVYFLVKTFFFVFLGLIIKLDNMGLIIYGVIAGLLLLLARVIAVLVSSIGSHELLHNKGLLATLMARGEAAAVLVQLVLASGISHADFYPTIVMSIILTTVIISSVGMLAFGRRYSVMNEDGSAVGGK